MSKAPAVDYALKIIEFFSENNRDLGIADISNALSINKNAVSRVLSSLSENGWIYCTDNVGKKYSLTLKAFTLVSKNISGNGLVKAAGAFVERLGAQTGDSVYLGVKRENSVLYLIHRDSVHEVRINGCVGGEYPLHCSAPGKVLLSYSEKTFIDEYFAACAEKRTDATITGRDEFSAEAAAIQKNRFAVDNEEFAKGIICFAAPVFDATGEAVASVGISSLTIYDTIESLTEKKGALVKAAAQGISSALGYIDRK